MNGYTLMFISSLSILLPALVGLVAFRQVSKRYHLFLLCIFLSAINELLSVFIITYTQKNISVNYNVYFLLEAILLTCQFRHWGIFKTRNAFFWMLLLLYGIVWLTTMSFIDPFVELNSYFIVFYSFSIVLMSVAVIEKQIKEEKRFLLNNPIFITCIGLIVFFSYTIVTEVFSIKSLDTSYTFKWQMLNILNVANIFTNGLYTYSIFRMLREKRSSFLVLKHA